MSIKHINSSNNVINTFTKWNDMDYIIGAGYDSAWVKQNGKNMTYQNNTGNYVQISYLVSCNDAVPASQADGMQLNLKTN